MGMECAHLILVEGKIPHGQFRRRRFREAGDEHRVAAVLFDGVGDLPTYISGFATTRWAPDVGFVGVRMQLLCYERFLPARVRKPVNARKYRLR